MLVFIVCAAMMFGGAGCKSEGLTPAQLQALAAQQEVLQQQVDTMQAAANKLSEDLAAAGIMDPDTVAKINKINEEADRVQAQIALIAQALQGVPLSGDNVQDFIAQLQAINAASAGFNPYVIPVGTGLTILTMVLGFFAKRKAAEAAEQKAKYQAHKQGVEKTMKEVSVSPKVDVRAVESRLYENIGEARLDLGV
jgi:prefoldin subunit 5